MYTYHRNNAKTIQAKKGLPVEHTSLKPKHK
jgi:hypothetical protein